jgi:hypothetical protein
MRDGKPTVKLQDSELYEDLKRIALTATTVKAKQVQIKLINRK